MRRKIFAAIIILLAMTTEVIAQDYIYMVKGKEVVQKISTSDFDRIYFNLPDSISEGPEKLDAPKLSLNSLGSMSLLYTVTPPTDDVKYYTDYLPKEKYDSEVANYGDISGFDKDYYQWLADMYYITWFELMSDFLKSGTTQRSSDDGEVMRWNTPYVVYAYCLDDKGNLVTDIAELNITTPSPEPSDNVINAEITNIGSNDISVSVTTTNNDQWFMTAQRKSLVDQFSNDDDLLFSLMQSFYNSPTMFYDGNLTSDDQFTGSLRPDTDYVLLIVGFDEGPTTELQKIEFHTAAKTE